MELVDFDDLLLLVVDLLVVDLLVVVLLLLLDDVDLLFDVLVLEVLPDDVFELERRPLTLLPLT